MRDITLIGTFGLSDEQISIIKENIPTKNCEVMDTDCFSDIVACSEMAIIVMWDKLSEDDRILLIEFYTEIAPFSETLVLIGDAKVPDKLKKEVSIYATFEEFASNVKYILLSAYRKTKKNVNFSTTLANSILILNMIRKKPYVTTKELAEKLERSERTVQRYIETLRVAGELIDYDLSHRGWILQEGKSILWGDL